MSNDFEGQAKTSLRMAANLAAGKDVMDGIENLHMEHKKVIVPAQDIDQENLAEFMNRYKD